MYTGDFFHGSVSALSKIPKTFLASYSCLTVSLIKLSTSQVNHSPSFHTDAPLDKEVKEGLLHDTLNLIDLFANDRRRCQEEDKRRVQERLLRTKPKDARY